MLGQTEYKGIQTGVSLEGIFVARLHYSCDPDKDPDTPNGAAWLKAELQGYKGLTDPRWQQEMEINFEAEAPGAYYLEEMTLARAGGRITEVEYAEGLPVHTAWDLGMDDSTTIWFYQQVFEEIHLIDYYEHSGEGLKHYVKKLEEKAHDGEWIYGNHLAPHDIKVRELGTGKSRLQTAKEMGLTFGIVSKSERKEDGIEAVRDIFNRCWFDAKKCAFGINALANYRKEYDERKRVYGKTPVHNWASHGADAFQTLALSYGMPARFDMLDEAFG